VVLFHRKILDAIRRHDDDDAHELMLLHVARCSRICATTFSGRSGRAKAKLRQVKRFPRTLGRLEGPTPVQTSQVCDGFKTSAASQHCL